MIFDKFGRGFIYRHGRKFYIDDLWDLLKIYLLIMVIAITYLKVRIGSDYKEMVDENNAVIICAGNEYVEMSELDELKKIFKKTKRIGVMTNYTSDPDLFVVLMNKSDINLRNLSGVRFYLSLEENYVVKFAGTWYKLPKKYGDRLEEILRSYGLDWPSKKK